MDWTFKNVRDEIAHWSIHEFIERAGMERFETGWSIKLDLSPPDFAAWEADRLAQFAFYARSYWLAARGNLEDLFRSAICDVRGHRMEDAGSYAGPESAADNFECSCCRRSFHHTYY